MNRLIVLTACFLTGLLAACTGGGEEVTAVPSPVTPATSAPALNPAAPEPDAGYPPAIRPFETSVAYPVSGDTVEAGMAYPVTVDLGSITPNPPDNTTPQVMPQPGVPNVATAVTQLASEDLAKRLQIDVGSILLRSSESVDWPDSSLGCPAPGYAYMQVITPGYKMTLEADGQLFDYHTDMKQHFVLCGEDGQPVAP